MRDHIDAERAGLCSMISRRIAEAAQLQKTDELCREFPRAFGVLGYRLRGNSVELEPYLGTGRDSVGCEPRELMHVALAAIEAHLENKERGLADGTVAASPDGLTYGPRAAEVLFYPGTGGEERLPVAYVSGYPRGPGGRCAFCHGDPTCEDSPPDSPIGRYFAAAPHASSCPVCDGRPS